MHCRAQWSMAGLPGICYLCICGVAVNTCALFAVKQLSFTGRATGKAALRYEKHSLLVVGSWVACVENRVQRVFLKERINKRPDN